MKSKLTRNFSIPINKRAKNILLNEDAYLKTSFSTPWVISSQLNERETIFIPLRYFVRQTRQTRFIWTRKEKHYYLPLSIAIREFTNSETRLKNSSPDVRMKYSPNEGITVEKWIIFDSAMLVQTLERKHEGITSRLKESWAREMLGWSGYHRVESRNVRRNFWRTKRRVCRLDEIRAAKRERATKSCGITFSLPRWMQKRPRVYPKYRTAQISRAAPVFSPSLSFPLAAHRLKIRLPH